MYLSKEISHNTPFHWNFQKWYSSPLGGWNWRVSDPIKMCPLVNDHYAQSGLLEPHQCSLQRSRNTKNLQQVPTTSLWIGSQNSSISVSKIQPQTPRSLQNHAKKNKRWEGFTDDCINIHKLVQKTGNCFIWAGRNPAQYRAQYRLLGFFTKRLA